MEELSDINSMRDSLLEDLAKVRLTQTNGVVWALDYPDDVQKNFNVSGLCFYPVLMQWDNWSIWFEFKVWVDLEHLDGLLEWLEKSFEQLEHQPARSRYITSVDDKTPFTEPHEYLHIRNTHPYYGQYHTKFYISPNYDLWNKSE